MREREREIERKRERERERAREKRERDDNRRIAFASAAFGSLGVKDKTFLNGDIPMTMQTRLHIEPSHCL